MIFSKILYDNKHAAEALFIGEIEDVKIEFEAILDSMSKNTILRHILLEAMDKQATKIERELNDE